MKDLKQAMKQVLPILAFILALILRQALQELLADHNTTQHSVLQEINTIYEPQVLGWIQLLSQDVSKELSPVFEAFENVEQHNNTKLIPLDFAFFFHDRWNALLMDRPPPFMHA